VPRFAGGGIDSVHRSRSSHGRISAFLSGPLEHAGQIGNEPALARNSPDRSSPRAGRSHQHYAIGIGRDDLEKLTSVPAAVARRAADCAGASPHTTPDKLHIRRHGVIRQAFKVDRETAISWKGREKAQDLLAQCYRPASFKRSPTLRPSPGVSSCSY